MIMQPSSSCSSLLSTWCVYIFSGLCCTLVRAYYELSIKSAFLTYFPKETISVESNLNPCFERVAAYSNPYNPATLSHIHAQFLHDSTVISFSFADIVFDYSNRTT